MPWDFVLLSETWRTDTIEHFSTEGGHIFVGCGGEAGKKGVAILIHAKWSKFVDRFRPVNNRVCFIDVSSSALKARIVCTYFPHGGYPDSEVNKTYLTLGAIHREAIEKKQHFI